MLKKITLFFSFLTTIICQAQTSLVTGVSSDSIAPAAISDLVADSSNAYRIYLHFTCTGDDSLTGTPAGFEIRFTEGLLNESTWVAATLFTPSPAVAEAGQQIGFFMGKLKPSTTYSIGIRVKDEVPNKSPVSNIVTVATLPFVRRPLYTMEHFIGTNAFIDVPLAKLEPLGFVREYHPWGFTEVENDQFEYNRWNGFWDFDNYYKKLHEAGTVVCPDIWGSPSWLKANDLFKPVVGSEDSTVPDSYREMSAMMFQFAARYGKTVVASSLLKVAAGQVKKSGLGYLQYYEDWNEQDRTWEGPAKRFTPQEYAAMASANADGHAGTMGTGYGIKQADPSAKLVMGGLATIGTDYVNAMMNWFIANRPDKKWPVDVINMHHYCMKNNIIGASPEDGQLKQKVEKVASWRNEFVPHNEFWLTEFGYDVNTTSVNRVPVFAGFSQEQVQAQWLLRSFLILSSTGVDRAAQFMLRNQEPANTEARFRDCGLTSSHNTGYVPKLSWYAVYTMKKILAGLYFNEVISETADTWAYSYTHPDSLKQVVALWCPTASGKKVSYRLSVPPGMNSASQIGINNTIGGSRTALAISSGELIIEVSEMPVFVEFSPSPGAISDADLAVNKYRIYPNPAYDFLRVEWNTENSFGNLTFGILDAGGHQLLTDFCKADAGAFSFDLKSLQPGNYILLVKDDENRYTQLIEKLY